MAFERGMGAFAVRRARDIGPHFDWRDGNRDFWRIFPDGRVEGK
jgi:hypothetical protein